MPREYPSITVAGGVGIKSIYVDFSGYAYAEDVSPSLRLVEMPDGDHPLSAGSVWKDIDGNNEAIVFIRQGVTAPEGDVLVANSVHETERLKYHYSRTNIGRAWFRHLVHAMTTVAHVGVIIVTGVAAFLVTWLGIYALTGVSIL